MNKRHYYSINGEKFRTLLANLSKGADVYIPVKKKDYLYYERFNTENEGQYTADQIRPAEPIKSFLTPTRERVDGSSQDREGAKQVLVGVKNCDITSLKIQDFVFKDQDIKDPFYVQKREDTTIISCDCNMLWESCFCVALGIDPYSENGFDLNLSKEAEDFVVEAGSKKGEDIIKKNDGLFSEATDSQINNRKKRRETFTITAEYPDNRSHR